MRAGWPAAIAAIVLMSCLLVPARAADDAAQLFYEAFEALKADRAQEAVDKFREGLKLDPSNATAQFYLGEAYHVVGAPKRARKQWQTALDMPPNSEWADEARNRLAATQKTTEGSTADQSVTVRSYKQEVRLACKKISGDVPDYWEQTFDLNKLFSVGNRDDISVIAAIRENQIVVLTVGPGGSVKQVISRVTGVMAMSECNRNLAYLESIKGSSVGLGKQDLEYWCGGEWQHSGDMECKPVSSEKKF
jgi:tetratricopeptide (TPR) repeat protein